MLVSSVVGVVSAGVYVWQHSSSFSFEICTVSGTSFLPRRSSVKNSVYDSVISGSRPQPSCGPKQTFGWLVFTSDVEC